MLMLIEWLKDHLLTCPSRYFLHFDCPGCGLQRSIIALVQGDFAESFYLYPATIPLMLMFVIAALHLKFNFHRGAVIIKWMFIFNAIIIIGFYIYKILTLKIF